MIKLRYKDKRNEFIDTRSGLINISQIIRCYYDNYRETYMVDVNCNYGDSNNIASYIVSKGTYDIIYKNYTVNN